MFFLVVPQPERANNLGMGQAAIDPEQLEIATCPAHCPTLLDVA